MLSRLMTSLLCLTQAFTVQVYAQQKAEVRIGVIVPLSGGLARRGDDIAKLLEILEPRLNQQSTAYTYRFLVDDGKCGNGSAASTIAQKFIHSEGVRFLITGCSGETLQVGPIAEQRKVLLFAVLSTHQDVKHLGEFIFRTFVDIERGVHGFARHMVATAGGPFALLTEENAFTYGIRDLLLKELGPQVTYSEEFALDSADFNTLLAKIKAKQVRGVYFNVMSEGTLATLVNQARALKLAAQFYSYNMPEATSFRAATGENSNGLEFIGSPVINQGSQDYEEVWQEYLRRHPEGPSYQFLLRATYDAVQAMVDGIEAVGPDANKVREWLKTYSRAGALGQVSFDQNGDVKGVEYVLKRIEPSGKTTVLGSLDGTD